MSVVSIAGQLAAAGCVFAEEEAAVLLEAARTAAELEEMIARRTGGEPLEHVVGWAEFRGLRFAVAPGVFVPRRRSELLVDEAASVVRCVSRDGPTVVVDLCCGVGAIGGALAAELPQVNLHAVDIDPRAVACAVHNLARWTGVVRQGDLFAALPRRLRRRVDVLVASPPYVPTGELRLLPAQARTHEPTIALSGGRDGVDLVERIARGASRWLSPHGGLALEVGESQLDRVEHMLTDLGYAARAVFSDGAAVVTARTGR